jgi:hypothetical protein
VAERDMTKEARLLLAGIDALKVCWRQTPQK